MFSVSEAVSTSPSSACVLASKHGALANRFGTPSSPELAETGCGTACLWVGQRTRALSAGIAAQSSPLRLEFSR